MPHSTSFKQRKGLNVVCLTPGRAPAQDLMNFKGLHRKSHSAVGLTSLATLDTSLLVAVKAGGAETAWTLCEA
ncbi:hypothetical protein EK904_005737 [Melospiza melodia maxima]|nr:hypothetical protein EK904_005737 [Melospiza melodia maxima]